VNDEWRGTTLKLKWLSLFLFVLFLGIGSSCAGAAPMGAGSGQDRDGWDAVPREFRDFQRQGYRDGLNGAQRDSESHRRPDVNSREEFRRPSVPPAMVNDYQMGYRRGYEAGVRHFFSGGVPAAMPQEQPIPRHEESPRGLVDYHRLGFNDGLIGAQKDLDSHRRPDVNNREEFRNPNVSPSAREDYREGYRRGYEEGIHRSYPNGLPAVMPWEHAADRWDAAPHEFNEMRRRGFEDGRAAAQADYDRRLRSDVDAHEEYRHPRVPFGTQEDYREGFRRGYDAATSHFYPIETPAPAYNMPPASPWLGVPRDAAQMQKVGYLDGILAAGQDYDAGLAPSLDSHEEYKSSKLSFLVRVVFKAGYKTGYELAMHNFADGIEGVSRPSQRRGFLDGVAAIRQDYDAKRRPDMNIHPEFNNPPVQPNEQEEYRDAYRHGFDMASTYLY
jgi:hypothetical protein